MKEDSTGNGLFQGGLLRAVPTGVGYSIYVENFDCGNQA